ncbi:MAG: HPr family phosphocarrier protein [Deltaproteobacteria bacterium]|nr:HPr family phosphocarrier protein [Deltaproteobacteria bacterium]
MNNEETFTIKNRLGLHARAAAKFVNLAGKFDSDIFIEKDGQSVNGKSIMGILILAAACGSTVKVKADGADSAAAVKAIGELIDDGFGEDEV